MNIKPKLIWLVTTLACITQSYAQDIPSFSGAEGFGAVTVGGRGGEVYHVTNLNDSGTGSFREAVEASGPRTVVFDVSGIIFLKEELKITNPYITIAGHTAPGDGVIIAGATVNMTKRVNDILIRYMRFRRSYDINGPFPKPNSSDAGQCLVGMSVSKNIMIDHVSASWGTDENMSMYRCQLDGGKLVPTKNITVQWSIVSEALNPANHAFANTWGGQGANHHHNLLACNVGRNPSISFSHFMDFRNNVIFNWRDRSMDGAGKEAHMNVLNNYYKPGPATGYNWDWSQPAPELKTRIVLPEVRTWSTWEELGLDKKKRYSGPGVIGWWYVDGNIMEGHPEVTNDNWEGESMVDGKYYKGVQWSPFVEPYPGIGPEVGEAHPEWEGDHMSDHLEWVKVDHPHTHVEFPEDPADPYDGENGEMFIMPDLPIIATQTAEECYSTVLEHAGATLPVRDPVDIRAVEMSRTGIATTGSRNNGIIDHPDEVGGFPTIEEVHRPANWDTDMDGMPNAWEISRGLDPNNKDDRNDDYDNDGYTNLEEYLNELGAFKAVKPVKWDGELNNRYAQIQNWDLAFQPSRFDEVIVDGATVEVDAIDQHAGILELSNGAILTIKEGWLDVATKLTSSEISQINVQTDGKIIAEDITNDGIFKFTGDAQAEIAGTFTNNGTLDISTWNGEINFSLVNNGKIIDGSGEITATPAVTLTAPSGSGIIEANTDITLEAEKSGDADITKVEFYQGDELLGTDETSPYSFMWSGVPSGDFRITAKAINDQFATISPAADITVTSFPSVSISSELLILGTEDSTTITADASDSDGEIVSVEFFQDQTSIAVVNEAPFTISWGMNEPGTYTLSSTATDNAGAVTTSEDLTITVKTILSNKLENKSIEIFPNPASDHLIIQTKSGKTKVSLMELSGKVIKTLIAQKGETKLDLTGMPKGIYLINVFGQDINETRQVIVK